MNSFNILGSVPEIKDKVSIHAINIDKDSRDMSYRHIYIYIYIVACRRAAVARRRRDIFAQERTRVKCGLLEQLVAAHRGVILCAKMAWRKGNVEKNQTRDEAGQEMRPDERLRKDRRLE
jgi:hypothetical protein